MNLKIGLNSFDMRKTALAILISVFLAVPAYGQQTFSSLEPDSVTVSVESLRELKHEYKILERQVQLQDSIIAEQEYQIELYERRTAKDSVILDLAERQLEVRKERIKIRDERIERLEEQKTWERIKRYIWTGGSLIIGFFVGNAI